MIRKEKDNAVWYEFELLQGLPLTHACTTRNGQMPLPSKVIWGKLRHGSDVQAIVSDDQEAAPADGLSTSTPNIALAITQADCQGAIFYDPIHHAISTVHCGWRGSVQNIYAATVAHMKEIYLSDPKDLLVCISPSLGPESAEFIHYKTELPESFWQFRQKDNFFDFWNISKWQLTEAGILPHHIQMAEMDTYLLGDQFFSYRRDKTTARQATFSMLH